MFLLCFIWRAASNAIRMNAIRIYLLTTNTNHCISRISLAHRRGVFSRGEPERPSKVWRPRRGLRPHLGGQRPASLEHDPKEQPLLPGPGNNDNKALGRVQKTSRWSAERRGVGSLRRRALAAKVRARVRSCTHPGATRHPGAYRRSARPSLGREMEKEEAKKKKDKKGGANEEKRSGQSFIAG